MGSNRRKYIVAADSFKGCMNTFEVESAISRAIRAADANADVVCIPVSDGGEGFLQAYSSLTECRFEECGCHDPLMRIIKACYGVCNNGYTVIETALSCGINLLEENELNPLVATSYGVGEMLADAIRKGHEKLLVGLGGSATSDCGLGMLKALIDKFCPNKTIYDLQDYFAEQHPELSITIACDVDAVLYGDRGAAYMFGTQKGAGDDMKKLLDRRAETFAEMAAKRIKTDMSMRSGAGAAGGLGYAFMQFLNAKVVSGIDVLLKAADFTDKLKDANLVITGEGRADRQTVLGKAAYGIMKTAEQQSVATLLIAGQIEDEQLLRDAGFKYVIPINNKVYIDKNKNIITDKDYNSQRIFEIVSNFVNSSDFDL